MPKKSSKKPTTSFQERIDKVVKRIPRGKILSYRDVARLTGRPRAWRAVGNILSKNQDPQVPCHRVIRSDGEIGGYRGGPRSRISTKFSKRKLNAAKRVEISLRGGQKKKIELLKREGCTLTKRRRKWIVESLGW